MACLKLQDPDETLDYSVDWSAELTNAGSDTISTSSWAVSPTGPTISTESNTTTSASCYLSGLTLGQRYKLTNTIVTTNSRTYERSFEIVCGTR